RRRELHRLPGRAGLLGRRRHHRPGAHLRVPRGLPRHGRAGAHAELSGARVDAIDLIEIHQLLGQYGHVVDAGEWHRFDELFTADAVLDYTGVRVPDVLHGRDAIVEFF